MRTSKLPDLDRISSKFFKNGPEFLALFFTNLSIKQSLIPHQGNNTKQKPLLEKDTKSDPTYCYLLYLRQKRKAYAFR